MREIDRFSSASQRGGKFLRGRWGGRGLKLGLAQAFKKVDVVLSITQVFDNIAIKLLNWGKKEDKGK